MSMYILYDNKKVTPDFKTFSGGEEHVQIPLQDGIDGVERVVCYAYIKSSRDFMRFVMMVNAATEYFKPNHLTLNIPYLPYARQDRVCHQGQHFGLEQVCWMLASLRPDEVLVSDVHSQKAIEILNSLCIKVTNTERLDNFTYFIKSNKNLFKDFAVISPDKGAKESVIKIAKHLNVDIYFGDKVRDPETGNLSGFTVDCDDLKGKNVWIVDDICDGGGTFLGLAEELKKRNAGKLGLFVTHGIFSKGEDVLYDNGFNYIGAAYDWSIPEIKEEF